MARFQAKQNNFLWPDFKLSRTTSVEICGRGGLTVTRLMANGGALLNSVMCRVSKEPDIIFLQVGGNDSPRTAWNQRDADAFSLQLLELASPLNDRYKARRVVVGCILPLPAVSCTQQALTVTVAISSGCLYEYVWSLDITK